MPSICKTEIMALGDRPHYSTLEDEKTEMEIHSKDIELLRNETGADINTKADLD